MAVELKITFTGGGNLGEDFVLDLSTPRLLGRTHTADVIVSKEDADVSKRHLEFRADGKGAAVVCLGRHGFLLDGQMVGEGESRPLAKGAELRLGKRVRIRVDRVGAADGDAHVRDVPETLATRPTGGPLTGATHETGTMTFATRATGGVPPYGGSIVETPIGEATSDAPTRFSLPAAAAMVTASGLAMGADAPTGGDVMDHVTFSGADAPSFSGATGGGETVAMETRVGNMDVIRAISDEKQRARRFKQRLLTLAACSVFAVLGALVYCFWPRAERWLAHPQPMERHFVKASSGATRLFVDFPKNRRTRTSDRAGGGIDVETLTGKAHDVPFRLSLDVRRDETELDLSLEESSEREISALRKQGYVFDPADVDGGCSFFERDYPKSCEGGGCERGVRFCRREFVRSDSAGQWHGILICFRDADTAYRLLREIPEVEWPRGEWLLREDPNIALYAGFLQNQWESPGARELTGYVGRPAVDLLKEIDAAFERNIPSEWKDTELKIDALILAGLRGDVDILTEAHKRLRALRKAKDLFYDECRARYDMGERAEAYAKCRGAFGNDARDLRSRRLANPNEWRVE